MTLYSNARRQAEPSIPRTSTSPLFSVTRWLLMGLVCCLSLTVSAQFQDANTVSTDLNNNQNTEEARREGATLFGVATGSPSCLLEARASDGDKPFQQIGQTQAGTFGQFDSDDQWIGLGLAGNQSAYGLAGSDRRKFLSLNYVTNTADLVLGFGQPADAEIPGFIPDTRFVLRNIPSPLQPGTAKDILVGLPSGAIGINDDPVSTLFVNGTATNDPAIFRAIAIDNERDVQGLSGGSAIGKQGNSSLNTFQSIAEGFRAQIPAFTLGPPTRGVATNHQAVFGNIPGGPNTTSNAADVLSTFNREYAEITWQDFDYLNDVTTNLNQLPANQAQRLDKMYVSFRNGRSVDPFNFRNKLPVMTFQANGRVGINTTQPLSGSAANPVHLTVNGGVVGTFFSPSDRRFKEDIKEVADARSLIEQLRPTTYTMRHDEFPDRVFSKGMHYGFIAQELEEVLPEATMVNSDGYYLVNYDVLVPVLTAALKEQQTDIDELRELNAQLAARVQELANRVEGPTGGSSNEPNNYLRQNRPNPFGSATSIDYQLPTGAQDARLVVYDLTGKQLSSQRLVDAQGTAELSAAALVPGTYLYGLVVDGEQLELRRMIVSSRD